MAFEFADMTKYLARGVAVVAIAFGASACSVMPSWMGGDSSPAMTADDQADQQDAANAPSPDLNSVPDKPTPPSNADDQKALSDSLGADRAQNQYSADQLRGGTEAAAPPPGAPPPPSEVADASAPAQPAAAPSPAPDTTAVPADAGSIDAAAAANASPSNPPPPATTADTSAPATPPPAQQTAMNAAPPAVASSGSGPAVPASSYGTYGMAGSMVSPSDAALGFKPSMAPPLSPSVAQFVPQPIIARYQQTAMMSRSAYSTTSESGYSATPVGNNGRAMGGPEHMSGAVVANFDSLNPDGAGMPADSAYGTPSAVVMFGGDRTILGASAREQVRAAAAAFQQTGGQGFVRVVGHSSSGGNLSSQRHIVLNFEHSQARATAVARELIKDGVPADKVLVETAGGADSGASAEIFLQS